MIIRHCLGLFETLTPRGAARCKARFGCALAVVSNSKDDASGPAPGLPQALRTRVANSAMDMFTGYAMEMAQDAGAELAMKACTAGCMKSQRSTPWHREVS